MPLLGSAVVIAAALAGCPPSLSYQGSKEWGPAIGVNRIFDELHTPAGLNILGRPVPYLVHEGSAYEVWYRLGSEVGVSERLPSPDLIAAFRSVYGPASCADPSKCVYEVNGNKFGTLGIARLIAAMDTGAGFRGEAFRILMKDRGRPDSSQPVFLQCIYRTKNR